MKPEQTLTVTLPVDLVERVNDKVSSGAFHSASDVVREGLEALIDRKDALDRWLRETVVAGHREYLSDPSKAVPADEILERIRRRKRSAG